MNDQAQEALRQVIRTYGAGICHTPRSCEMFIRQACGAYPDESRVLIEALRTGVTGDLVGYTPTDSPWDEFSGKLRSRLKRTGLDDVEGSWAVETWARVLGRHPETYVAAPPPRPYYPPEVQASPDRAVKVVMALIVGLGGGIGGFVGSAMVPAAILITSAAVDMPILKEMGIGKGKDIWTVVLLIVGVIGGIGFIGGAIGGVGGWFFGRGDRGHWNAFLAACGGAFISSALASYFCGIFGSAIGSLIGAFGAAMTTASRGGMA